MKTEKTNASKSKTVLFFINVVIIIAMIIHVAIRTDLHLQHPEYSSPAAIELLNALYYIIPFVVRYVVRTKIRHKQAIQNIDKNTAYPAILQDMRCYFGRSEKI